MPSIRAIDTMLARMPNVDQNSTVGAVDIIILLIVVVLLAQYYWVANALDMATQLLIVGLAEDMSAWQGHHLGVFIEADGTRGRDAEYLSNVIVTAGCVSSSSSTTTTIAKDIGFDMMDEVAGWAFQAAAATAAGFGRSAPG